MHGCNGVCSAPCAHTQWISVCATRLDASACLRMWHACSEGNKTPKKEPGPVVLVLKPKPHPSFVRRGNDLVHKVTLPLYQALIGASIEINTLDNRNLKVGAGADVPVLQPCPPAARSI